MADDMLGLTDVIGDALDLSDIEVSDVLREVPLLNLMPMEPSSNGYLHSYSKETVLPTVGFRAVNAGREMDHSTHVEVDVTLKHLDFSWAIDIARTTQSPKGPEWVIAQEGLCHLRAALVTFEKQVINGVIGASDSAGASGSADGFSGLRDAGAIDAVADAMVVNAGGATADTQSSVYAVRIARNGVTGIYRGDGPALTLGETTITQWIVNPGSDNKTFPAYYTPAGTWLALQVGSAYDVGRIANLDATATLSDDLISDLLALFPVGRTPTHLIMSRRSRQQLQDSRTATNSTGAPAPFPQEAFGVPIIVSDNVSNTEEILT